MRPRSGMGATALRCLAVLGILGTQSVHAASTMSSRTAFVARHRCAVLTRLERIHQRGPISTSRDRFIIASLWHSPQSYVQCIFFDNDTKMRCEAASGAFRSRAEDPPEIVLSPTAVIALHGLGFTQASPAENYAREVEMGAPPDLASVADLILTTLHDVYGADATTRMSVIAPKANVPVAACAEPSV